MSSKEYHRQYYHKNKKRGLLKPKKEGLIDKKEIVRLYLNEKLGCMEIARKFNTYMLKINRILKKEGIKLRTYQQACKLKKGAKSPVWNGYGKISGNFWSRIECCAKHRNIIFDIDIKYAWKLYLKQNGKCALSGINLIIAEDYKKHNRGTTTASLDRIDSNKGYIKGNIQWVHKNLNIAKSDMSNQEFINWCKMVVKYKGENHHLS